MKFLVDNQLPTALARALDASGVPAAHVLDIGLGQSEDIAIWTFAHENQWILVSKDEDFFHLANRPGDQGLLLWLRIGNCRKQALLNQVLPNFQSIAAHFESGQRIVEFRT